MNIFKKTILDNNEAIMSYRKGIKYCQAQIKKKSTKEWEKKEYRSVMALNRTNILKLQAHNKKLSSYMRKKR